MPLCHLSILKKDQRKKIYLNLKKFVSDQNIEIVPLKRVQIQVLTASTELRESKNVEYEAISIDYEF